MWSARCVETRTPGAAGRPGNGLAVRPVPRPGPTQPGSLSGVIAGSSALRQKARIPTPGATDVHAHVMTASRPAVPGVAYAPFDAPVERFLAHLDAIELQRGVLVTPSVYGTDNTVLIDALRTAPGRLRGVAVLGWRDGDKALSRLDAAGVRACRARLVDDAQGPGLLRLQERVRDLGWHVEVWTPPWLYHDVLRAAAERGRLVLDHLGLIPAPPPGAPDPAIPLLRAALSAGDVWVTLSGAYRLIPGNREAVAARALRDRVEKVLDIAPDRVIWGSDWPYVNPPGPPPTPADHRAVLHVWLPDAEMRRRVLIDNPSRLYKWAHDG
ncbi:MAG: amidohydrolase family protein [Frankiaceae bacterium]